MMMICNFIRHLGHVYLYFYMDTQRISLKAEDVSVQNLSE